MPLETRLNASPESSARPIPSPSPPAPHRWLSLLSLTALWAAIWLPRLGHLAIFDYTDAMFAEVPREMLRRGDWITPYANSLRYLEKPPLFYWLVAGGYRVFGVSTTSARLVGALVCLGIVLVTYLLGELLFSPAAAWIAGATLATSAGYFIFAQQLMPDPLLTLLLSLAFYTFLRGDRQSTDPSTPGWHLAAFAFIGLAVLAKGLIGLVFPLLTLGAYALIRQRAGEPVRLPLLPGLLIFAAVAVPWHLLVGLRNPGWAWFYFINEHVLRFLNRRVPRDYTTVPLVPFWLLHFVWLFPWSVFLPLALRDLWRSLRQPQDRRARRPAQPDRVGAESPPSPTIWRDGLIFAGLWAGSVLCFFSFSTRLEYYTLPAFPALALLIGATGARCFSGGQHQPSPRRAQICLAALVLVTAILLLVAAGLAVAAHVPPDPRHPIVNPDSSYDAFFFGHLPNLTLERVRGLMGLAIGVTLPVLVGSLTALFFARRGPALWTPYVLALAMVPSLHCLRRSIEAFEEDISSRGLARTIMQDWQPGDRIVVDGLYETCNSLSFYTGQPIYILEARRGYLEYGSRYPDAPPLFLDRQQLRALLRQPGPGRLFLITRTPARRMSQFGPAALLRESGGRSLLLLVGYRAVLSPHPPPPANSL